jgi:hypothetical protein
MMIGVSRIDREKEGLRMVVLHLLEYNSHVVDR